MIALGFVLAAAFWPAFAEPGNSAKWLAASVLIPWLLVHAPRVRVGLDEALGLAFLAFGIVSLAWTPSIYDTLNAVWQWLLLAGAFLLGKSHGARGAMIGFAAGVSLSGCLAAMELVGAIAPMAASIRPGGLIGMKNYMAEAGLMATVAAMAYRAWWAVPGSLLAFALPVSRAAFASAGLVALVWAWRRVPVAFWLLVLSFAVVAIAFVLTPDSMAWDTLWQRLELWRQTVNGLTLFGYGLGSYWAAFPGFQVDAPPIIYGFNGMPAQAHNDALQLASEMGIAAVLVLVLAWRAAVVQTVERWAFLAFLCLGLAAFPLFNPATGLMGAVLAGALSRARSDLRLGLGDR